MSIFFVGIDSDMMFLYLNFGRNKAISSGYGIRKLFSAVFAKLCSEFFLCHVMVDPFYGKPDISRSFLPFFFTGRGAGTSSCSGSRASRLQTTSASLKKTIVPSTSMKLIWLASSIFSEDLPKRFLFARTICSIISCIFSLREQTSAVRV